jgi:hypothetical protein
MARPRRTRLVYCVLGIAAWLCALACLPCGAVVFFLPSEPRFRPVDLGEFSTTSLRDIPIVTPDEFAALDVSNQVLNVSPASQMNLRAFLPVLAEEIELYPSRLIWQLRLNRIVLCTRLSLNAQPIGGIVDFQRGDLYLDSGSLAANVAYARKAIHHEIFHLLDYRRREDIYRDSNWEALNAPGFQYSGDRRFLLSEPNSGVESSDLAGFLNHYSTCNVAEDKAEVFAFLMVQPDKVAERARSDRVLQSKVIWMKVLLETFCSALDDEFWERISNARRQKQ